MVDISKRLLRTVFRLERRAEVAAGMLIYNPYQPIPWLGKLGGKRYVGTFARWDAIEKVIPPPPRSVLDIGSNIGFFSLKLAERGYIVIGVEAGWGAYRLGGSLRDTLDLDNVACLKMTIQPSNIDALPSVDIMLFLSVFHHWILAYGFEEASMMLGVLLNKTKEMLFFETGQSTDPGVAPYLTVLPDMKPDPRTWMTNFLLEVGASEVQYLGNFPVGNDPQYTRCLMCVYP